VIKKKILVICFNTLHNDPRVLRQINALKKDYEVITAGYSDSLLGPKHVQLKEYVYKMIDFYFNYPLPFRKLFAGLTQLYLRTKRVRARVVNVFLNVFNKAALYERQYWTDITKENYKELNRLDVDLILANDIHTLPLAVKLKRGNTKLIFDAHEYSPGENDSNPDWVKRHKPQVEYFCRKNFKDVNLMFCVGYSIADEYKKNFGISSVVITNATDLVNLDPAECKSYPVKLIHHGASIPERHLELMIEAMDLLDEKYTLDLMLVPTDENYLNKLKKMSETRSRVNFIEPVPTDGIPYILNNYDAGIVFIPPTNFNYQFCLPNKFYESVQGRVALILGPTKDMVDISKKYNNAVVTKDFSAQELANTIRELSPEKVNVMKKNSDNCAKELNASKNKELMLKEINQLVKN
jgi:glycosyltransferase involved in cell wall biosynthesis